MSMEKQIFLEYVVHTMQKHPEWFGDLVYALQSGLTNALEVERKKVTDLAYGMAAVISDHPAYTRKNAMGKLYKSLCAMRGVFTGSEFWRGVKELIEEDNNEDEI